MSFTPGDIVQHALQLGRDAVMESFDHVNCNDAQILADARLQAIDMAIRINLLRYDAIKPFADSYNEDLNENILNLTPRHFRLAYESIYEQAAALSKAEGHIGQEPAPDRRVNGNANGDEG